MDYKENLLFKANYFKYLDFSFLIIISYTIFKFIEKIKISKKIINNLKFIWLIKLLFIILIIPLYEINFSTDSDQYFRAAVFTDFYSEKYRFNAYHFPNEFSNTFLIIIIKIINFFTFNSWFALKLFLGIIYLKILVDFCQIHFFYTKKYPTFSIFIVAFTPSFLLYSQLILKDIFIIFLLSHIFKEIIISNLSIKKLTFSKILILVLAFITIFFLRYWVFWVLIIAIVLSYIISTNFFKILLNFISKNLIKSMFVICAGYFIFLIFYDQIFREILTNIFRQQILKSGNSAENLSTEALNGINNFGELIFRYPYLIFKSYFNPFLNEILNWKYTLFVFENLLILLLLLTSYQTLIYNYKKNCLLINYIIILGFLYSINNFLNPGSALRYALQYKIFLIMSFFYFNPKIEIFLIKLHNTINKITKNN